MSVINEYSLNTAQLLIFCLIFLCYFKTNYF